MSTRKGRIISLLTIVAISIGLIGGIIGMQYKELTKASAAAKTIGNYSFYEMSAETPIDYTDCFTWYNTQPTYAEITGLTEKGKQQTKLITPTTYDNKPVKYITKGGIQSSILKSLTISTEIQGSGLSGYLLEGVTSIEELVFYPTILSDFGAKRIYSLFGNNQDAIPATLKKLEFLGETLPAIGAVPSLQSVKLSPNITNIPISAFAECPLLSDINLQHVQIIGASAFRGTSLKSAALSQAQTIGDNAFRSCKALENVIFSHTITTISQMAFAYTNALSQIYIPNSVLQMGASVFMLLGGSQTVYCESESRPAGWATNWAETTYGVTIIWGA